MKYLDNIGLQYFWDKIKSKIGTDSLSTDAQDLSGAVNELYSMMYPVGSVYISVTDDTVDKVQARFGGTWVAFGSGQTLVGVKTSDTDFSTVEKTGGAKSHDYTPAGTNTGTALTTAQLPKHTHTYAKPNTPTGSTTLTVDQIPSHSHVENDQLWSNIQSTVGSANYIMRGTTAGNMCTIRTNGGGMRPEISTKNTGGGKGHTHTITTTSTNSGETGSGNTHTHTFTGTKASMSHLQPYVTVYMYKRIA